MDDRNTWPGGVRKALHQDEHERVRDAAYAECERVGAIAFAHQYIAQGGAQ